MSVSFFKKKKTQPSQNHTKNLKNPHTPKNPSTIQKKKNPLSKSHFSQLSFAQNTHTLKNILVAGFCLQQLRFAQNHNHVQRTVQKSWVGRPRGVNEALTPCAANCAKSWAGCILPSRN